MVRGGWGVRVGRCGSGCVVGRWGGGSGLVLFCFVVFFGWVRAGAGGVCLGLGGLTGVLGGCGLCWGVVVERDVSLVKTSNKATTPWACQHSDDASAIDAYIEGVGEWATIARTQPVDGVNPQEIAEQIIRAVNLYEKQQSMLAEMVMTLKLCLECEGITWEAEHDAEILINRFEAMKK